MKHFRGWWSVTGLEAQSHEIDSKIRRSSLIIIECQQNSIEYIIWIDLGGFVFLGTLSWSKMQSVDRYPFEHLWYPRWSKVVLERQPDGCSAMPPCDTLAVNQQNYPEVHTAWVGGTFYFYDFSEQLSKTVFILDSCSETWTNTLIFPSLIQGTE